jgi:hypothetical protein
VFRLENIHKHVETNRPKNERKAEKTDNTHKHKAHNISDTGTHAQKVLVPSQKVSDKKSTHMNLMNICTIVSTKTDKESVRAYDINTL